MVNACIGSILGGYLSLMGLCQRPDVFKVRLVTQALHHISHHVTVG